MFRAILSQIFIGLPDLALTSTVPFIFHFLRMFLTVEMGSLKHLVFSSLLLIGGINHLHSEILGFFRAVVFNPSPGGTPNW